MTDLLTGTVRTAVTDAPILEVTNLSVEYSSEPGMAPAVQDVSITLRRGEFLGIAGESGSGKSTLAYAMTRLLRPPGIISAGSVRFYPRDGDPVDVLRMRDEELRTFRWAELAVVLQSAMNALNPVLSLRAQLTDVLIAHRPGMSRQQRLGRLSELLVMVGIPADRASAFPHELSGGMRQRAMIALALALDPDIIVMDEPTTALDVVIQRQILSKIMTLKEQLGFSVIFITHDLSLLVEIADTIAIMYAGRIVETAPSAEIFASPRHPYSYGLLTSFPQLHGPRRVLLGVPGAPPSLRSVPTGCAFHPRCPHALTECAAELPLLERSPAPEDTLDHAVACHLYAGGPAELPRLEAAPTPESDPALDAALNASAADDGAVVLEARNLTKHFRLPRAGLRRMADRSVVHAVDGADITLRAGRITALVGESGSGKSTVARLLAQIYKPTSGTITLAGKQIRARSARALRRHVRQVQLVFQDPFGSLNPTHTIAYLLARPLRVHGFARSQAEASKRVHGLLSEVGLTPPELFAEKFPHELSGGQRQRISVARALAAQPSVLLADEPVSMLDVSIRLGVLNLLRRLTAEHNLALLYITHDIASARYFAAETLVMYAGQLVEGGPSEAVTQSPAHPYTQLLIASAPDPGRQADLGEEPAGEPPSLVVPPSGCRFHPRCPHAMDVCRSDVPPKASLGNGHWANCWLHVPHADRPAQ